MAGDEKLLGTLKLSAGDVLSTIQKVNDAMKTLGQGVNLDLTNNLKASVENLLAPIKKQMDEIAKASTGHSAQQVSDQTKVTSLLKQQYQFQIEMVKSTSKEERSYAESKLASVQRQLEYYQLEKQELVEQANTRKELITLQERQNKALVHAEGQYSKEQRKADLKEEHDLVKAQEQDVKDLMAARDAANKAWEKSTMEAAAAQKKQQDEIRDYNVKSLNDQMKARQDYVNWWVKALAEQEANQKKAFDSEVQSASRLYQEIKQLESQLGNTSVGPQQRGVIAAQLAEKQRAYEGYTKAVRDAAEKDKDVLALQQQISLETARQADAANAMMGNRIATKVGQFSLSLIKEQWNAAVEYASSYYDQLNEIRTITGKTEDEAAKMGDRLRKLAKDMSVTSTELATAAVTFYRQGLEDSQVNARLEWVTKYAKVAKVEFSSAAELVTAAMNSMSKDIDGDVQRVVDVFLYLGDAAATSGEEIGKAMQKASASATEFGLSFEWLGAYIATVSETTRQAPESIGNAFNSMLARLHNIKQNGFNEEDATKINDVAKALSNVDIALLDQEGNWRNMSDIFEDISSKWADMSDKQKSYIATTVAGTRQQNVFFALMNDMSKGIEDGSRAWELYTGALNAAGTATEKYNVWEESVEAAQSRLKNSFEGLYSAMQPGIIKDFYNALSGLVDGITRLGPLPMIITAIATAVVVLGTNIHNLGGILLATKAAFLSHPLFAIATQSVGIITALGALAYSFPEVQTAAENFAEASERYSNSQQKMQDLIKLQAEMNTSFAKMSSEVGVSNKDIDAHNKLLDKLAEVSPNAKMIVDQLRDGFIDQKTAVKELNDELNGLEETYKKLSQTEAMKMLNNLTPSDGLSPKRQYTIPQIEEAMSSMGYGAGKESFTNFLRNRVGLQYYYGQIPAGSEYAELINQIGAKVSEAANDLFRKNWVSTDEEWGSVGDYVWQLLFGDKSPEEQRKQLDKEIDRWINIAMTAVGEVPEDVGVVLRQRMREAIIGDDNELWGEDFNEQTREALRKIVLEWRTKGAEMLSNEERLGGIIGVIAENVVDKQSIVDAFKDEIAEIASDKELTDAVIGGVEDQLKTGLSGKSLLNILTEVLQGLSGFGESSASDILEEYLFGYLFDKEDIESAFANFTKQTIGGEWLMLDEEAMALMSNLALQGKTYEEFLNIFNGTNIRTIDDFKNALKGLNEEASEVSEETSDDIEKAAKSFDDVEKEISKIDALLKTLGDGNYPSLSDILDLAKTHPEILSAIDSLETLESKQKEIREIERNESKESLRNYVLNDSNLFMDNQKQFAGSPQYWEARQSWLDKNQIKTFQDQLDYQGAKEGTDSAIYKIINASIENIVSSQVDYVNNTDEATGATEEYTNALSGLKDVIDNLTNVSDAKDALEVLNNPGESSPEKVLQAIETLQKIFPELKDVGTEEFIGEATIKTNELEEAARQAAEQFGVLGQVILDSMEQGKEKLDELAEKASEGIEMAMAATNNYQEQLTDLMSGMNAGGLDGLFQEWDLISPKIQEAISNQFPQLIVALQKAKKAEEEFGKESEEAAIASKNLATALNNATKLNTAKYFTNTLKAMDGVAKGTVRVVDGYETMNKEIEKAVNAQIEYEAVSKEMAAGNEVNANSISNLASLLGGLDPEWILNNWSQIGPMMSDALAEGENAIQAFNEAAFIVITGITDVDFSQLLNGLIDVNSLAEEAVQRLAATGQWEVVTIDTPQEAWIREGNKWTKKTLPAKAKVLKPTGNNPFGTGGSSYKPKTGSGGSGSKGRSGGGGGGGGGGSSSSNAPSEVEVMLDQMEQIQKLYQYRQNMFQAEQNYYQQTGELQGVILYLQKEGEVLLGQNKVLEENIAEIESWMTKKKAELDALSNSSEEYKEAADDLKALQERHQQYTKELIDNKTQIDKLNKAIKEQNDKIRDMEIDLRNTILEAIKDREALNDRMLQGTITTENTILELIQKRYEKERDLILDNTQKQIDALKEERDLMSEQLQLRREQQEMEDKAAKLAELEAQYARIMADPTRRNEALNLQDQIKNLRDEIAWETAENEIKAKQEDIDNQISSLEDYVAYVEDWYNELFEHPQALIEEMKSIIVQADDDIISWLKQNSDEFAEATEATQTNMINNWHEMLMDMHGQIKTYWDEVEQIIAGGDEAIIKFLVENSADYREAGRLQAQAYVDAWKKQLTDLALAHKKVTETLVMNTYAVFNAMAGGKSGSSSGGGGSSSGGGGSSKSGSSSQSTAKSISAKTTQTPKYYTMTYMGKTGTGTSLGAAYDELVGKAGAAAEELGYDYFAGKAVPHYKNGGKVDFTGLAWMDGTKSNHEDVLNPYQSELFESLVRSIEQIAKVRTPTLPVFENDLFNGRGNAVSFGDIVLNVDKLETDDDYEEVADRVMELVMDRINRGSAVGGIRY